MKLIYDIRGRILVIFAFLSNIIIAYSCFEPSEPLPAPSLDPRSSNLAQLFAGLDSTIQKALSTEAAPWNTTITSFAIEVTSAKQTLWQSYHTAPLLGEYAGGQSSNVTGGTSFRIASISKVFTVLAILLQQQEGNLSLKDPVTKYLPELLYKDVKSGIQWEHIDLESLASQLSGVPREYGQEDFADDIVARAHGISNQQEIGLPSLHDDELPTCGMNHETSKACSKKDILQGLRKRHPVFPPNYKSTYSNIAFILLGFVLEKVTGKSYQDAISASILEPLGMHQTTVKKPKDSMAVIPAVTNDWKYVAGAYNPTGGIYSTSTDLSIFLRAILNSELLDESTTNAWFKPHSWSSGLNAAYGMPWEIYRTTKLLSDSDRGMTIVTKGGALYGYYSHIILLPEYNFAITVLVAGDSQALQWLEKQVLTATTRVVESLARSQTKERYAGKYQASGINSSLALELNGSSGLVIDSWISNGTDFLLEYVGLHTGERDLDRGRVQLLPAGIRRSNGGEVWRASFVPSYQEIESVIDSCMINDVDDLMYGDRSLQEFVFVADGGGKITLVELPGLRVVMEKQSDVKRTKQSAGSRGWGTFQHILGLGATT